MQRHTLITAIAAVLMLSLCLMTVIPSESRADYFFTTEWIPVSNITDLNNIRQNTGGSYYLTNDIDASVTASWNDGAGWIPIPTFTGKINGAGYAITGLFINSPNDKIGLISTIKGPGNISNLYLLDVNITGNNNVGGIAGEGLAFYHFVMGGSGWYDYSYLYRCHVSGIINGNDNIGMLIGKAYSTIIESSATGQLSANDYVGGLVGFSTSATLTNSFFIGTINSDGNQGGLIGRNEWTATSNSYAAANLTNPSYGLIGIEDTDATTAITSSFMDSDIVPIAANASNYGLISGEAMRALSTYDDWDFTNVWSKNAGGLPYMQWSGVVTIITPETPEGPGDPDTPETPEGPGDPDTPETPDTPVNEIDYSIIYAVITALAIGLITIAALITRHPIAVLMVILALAWAAIKYGVILL